MTERAIHEIEIATDTPQKYKKIKDYILKDSYYSGYENFVKFGKHSISKDDIECLNELYYLGYIALVKVEVDISTSLHSQFIQKFIDDIDEITGYDGSYVEGSIAWIDRTPIDYFEGNKG